MKLRSITQQSTQNLFNNHNNPNNTTTKDSKLSSFINNTHAQINQKLSLVHRGITHIDLISSNYYSNIKTLYLSGNLISSLQNIHYFINIESLSLANNNVEYYVKQVTQLSSLRYLLPLKKLANIVLENNPITKQTLYVPFVIGMIDNIHMLDHHIMDRKIIQTEYSNFLIYQETMHSMLKNYISLLQIYKFYKQNQIHQLIKRVGNQIQGNQNIKTQAKVQHYLKFTQNYYNELPTKVLINFQNHLYYDIQSMYKNVLKEYHHQKINISKYQIFFTTMHKLQNKQLQKIQEIKQRFYLRDKNLFQSQEKVQREYLNTKQLIESVFQQHNCQSSAKKMFIKLISKKYFNLLKKNYLKKKSTILSCSLIIEVLEQKINSEINIFFWKCLKKQDKQVKSKIIISKIMQQIVKPLLFDSFYLIKEEAEQKLKVMRFKQKLQDKMMKKRIFMTFAQNMKQQRLKKTNQILNQMLKEKEIRQEKLVTKIQVLEKLLIIAEQQCRNQLNGSQYKKITKYLDQKVLLQSQYVQNQRYSHLMHTNDKQNTMNYNNRQSASKQQENISQQTIIQRKFNSKKKQENYNYNL